VVTATAPLLWAAARRAAAALCPTAQGVFNVADLGCSQGKNSLAPCRTVVRALEEHRSLLKEAAGGKALPGQLSMMVFHEDLPSQVRRRKSRKAKLSPFPQ
jgi:hypothetical protein